MKDPELLTAADFPVEFGRYRLLSLLGEGGMGRVFEAELTAVDWWVERRSSYTEVQARARRIPGDPAMAQLSATFLLIFALLSGCASTPTAATPAAKAPAPTGHQAVTCTAAEQGVSGTTLRVKTLLSPEGCLVEGPGIPTRRPMSVQIVTNVGDYLKVLGCTQVRPVPSVAVNFDTHRVAIVSGTHLNDPQDATVPWVVAQDDAIVIGVSFDAYCRRGAAKSIGYEAIVVLPKSNKPVKARRCYRKLKGPCPGGR